MKAAYRSFEKEYMDGAAKIVCCGGTGRLLGGREADCRSSLDTVAIAVYSESFGGPKFMTGEMIEFIRNWEVERYRAQVTKA
ncbi:MAG: hypothetical protein ACOXZ7_08310 [Sphaerochaeta sp.]